MAILGFGILVLTQPPALAEPPQPEVDNETCLMCHGDPAESKFIDPPKFQDSIHGRLLCTSCHNDISEVPHEVPLQAVSCGQCHRIETEVYLQSDHGKATRMGNSEAATCRDCHGDPHQLLNSRDPASRVHRMNIPKTCGTCHQDTTGMEKFHLNQDKPIETYGQSVHGLALEKGMISAAVCTDCHGSHDLHRSTNPESKLHWQKIPTTCGRCHENIRTTYSRSVHGRAVETGKRDAPVCTDCHGEHTIDAVKLASSKVYPSHIPETCGQCHGTERITTKYRLPAFVVDTYMGSYHGLAIQLGSLTAANCASCHGFHDILPHTDPRSSIHPDNLPKTCGKCHAGVSTKVTQGQIHSGTRPGRGHQILEFVRTFYIGLILVVLTFMLIHNGMDFLKKLRRHYLKSTQEGKRLRMNTSERIQHAFLAIAFILLAYTGFALKYPQSWWASPFMGRVDWRSLGHRIGAIIFCVLAVYHILYVTFSARGRKHFKALLLRRIDVIQLGQMFLYFLGKRKEKPVFAFYGYAEKIEYWALVWGSMIMIITGVFLLNENFTLRFFPKWFFDLVNAIHFYEAVLACLAILIWHGYFVMFDPDEYPMKWSWISGVESPADKERKD